MMCNSWKDKKQNILIGIFKFVRRRGRLGALVQVTRNETLRGNGKTILKEWANTGLRCKSFAISMGNIWDKVRD